jgi:ABC-2 type transport system ATP-binding protein
VATGLSKRFGELEAVRGVDLEVHRGEIFAFLGPNGAGKTTTINMLCTLLRPTRGEARVAGHDVVRERRAVRASIGLVFQDRTLDAQLTAEENLTFHAVLYGLPRAEIPTRISRVLEMVDLADRRKDLVGTFSGGMARRLEIARGLMHAPEVLFLDEPTLGLDPQTRARIWEDAAGCASRRGSPSS